MIGLIFTGGTIAMTLDTTSGGAIPTLTGGDLLERMNEIRSMAQFDVDEYGKYPGPHMTPARMLEVAESLGTVLPAEQTYLVPLATADAHIGCLVLLDPNGETPDDRPMEAYASHAAVAWRHASLHHGRS